MTTTTLHDVSLPTTVSVGSLTLRLPDLPLDGARTFDDWYAVARARPSKMVAKTTQFLAGFLTTGPDRRPETPSPGDLAIYLTGSLRLAIAADPETDPSLVGAEETLVDQEIIVALLLAAGAPVKPELLRWAATCINPRLMRRLLDAGPATLSPDAFLYRLEGSSGEQSTPIHQLIEHNAWSSVEPMLKMLLAVGHPIDLAESEEQRTPVHAAAIRAKLLMLAGLIAAGANLDLQDKWGNTAAHWAVSMDVTDVLARLLDANARTDLTDRSGHTLLQNAARHGAMASLALLLALDLSQGPADEVRALELAQAVRDQKHTTLVQPGAAGCVTLLEQRQLRATLATMEGENGNVPQGSVPPRRRL